MTGKVYFSVSSDVDMDPCIPVHSSAAGLLHSSPHCELVLLIHMLIVSEK